MEQIIDLILAGQWKQLFGFALLPVYAAIVNGLIVRMTKEDAKGPNIPARFRPFVAFGLGIVEVGLLKVMAGTSWKAAFVGALVAGLLPIVAHQLVIEGVFAGKEIPLGPLQSKGPDSKRIPTIGTGAMMVLLAGAAAFLIACWSPAKTAASERAVGDLAQCALQQLEKNPEVTAEEAAANCSGLAIVDAGKILVAAKHVTRVKVSAVPCSSSSGGK